jgi:hypothetical protein
MLPRLGAIELARESRLPQADLLRRLAAAEIIAFREMFIRAKDCAKWIRIGGRPITFW